MDTRLNSHVVPQVVKAVVSANNIVAFFEQHAAKFTVLSLDCFDTILLRKTATPIDVFYDLQHEPAFQAANLKAEFRVNAENVARQRMHVREEKIEVSLHDIYLAHDATLEERQIDELIAQEIAAEKSACYLFPPIIELIRLAQKKGMKIIIVSDTYFNSQQLRELLQHHLPSDVMNAIDEIFCSSEYGRSKKDGLFKEVLKKIATPALQILHLGDNAKADYHPPLMLGMHALHLLHHQEEMVELLRMQALAANVLEPALRAQRSMVSPYRGVFAMNFPSQQADISIGYATLGPILFAFAEYILQEKAKLIAAGKRPKFLFLMRDAYLPSLVCEALAGEKIGERVRISRFTAYAASFRSQADIEYYVADAASSLRFEDICRQLLLPSDITQAILQKINVSSDQLTQFYREIRQEKIIHCIVQASYAYRARLKCHLESIMGLTAGDTLVFVDLGYSGTAERLLAPVFKDEMQVEIIGRYLLSLPTPMQHHQQKAGLLDETHYDARALLTLVSYIALLEQLCTSNEKSTVDFDEQGHPIFAETAINASEQSKLSAIHQECLRFIHDTKTFFTKANVTFSMNHLRDAAFAALARLIFIPRANELEFLKTFQFDVNLGTNEILSMFDEAKGRQGLRQRGLFFMEKNLKSMRTNYPAELRSAGLELALMLMIQNRYQLEFMPKDMSLRREHLPVIVMRQQQFSQVTIEALPTHDGYFAALIPVAGTQFQIALPLGQSYHWVQIESISLIKNKALYKEDESQHSVDVADNVILEQMQAQSNGLFECINQNSLLLYAPVSRPAFDQEPATLRFVFRPISYRAAVSA